MPAKVPAPVIRRWIEYLNQLKGFERNNREWVSSRELAKALSLTDATVRQDFLHLDFFGEAGRGYEVAGLKKALAHVLGLDTTTSTAIVGAGNLGRALAQHAEFSEMGFEIRGIFDVSTSVIGQRVGHLVVQDVQLLQDVVKEQGIEIGIIAVPASAARVVALALISAGVRALLNLTATHLNVPDYVTVVHARIVHSLEELSCAMKMRP